MSAADLESGNPAQPQPSGRHGFVMVTLIAAAVAAVASAAVAALSLPVWIMFVGFIAWFTRPVPVPSGLCAILCLWLGIVLAPVAFAATALAAPVLGVLALPAVVFAITLLVVALRTTKFVDNMPCWFLGFVTFSAAGRSVTVANLLDLALASAIGAAAGWVCQALSARYADGS